MEIAVLGGGNGSLAAAADLTEQGHRVRLWRRNPDAVAEMLAAGPLILKDAGVRLGALGERSAAARQCVASQRERRPDSSRRPLPSKRRTTSSPARTPLARSSYSVGAAHSSNISGDQRHASRSKTISDGTRAIAAAVGAAHAADGAPARFPRRAARQHWWTK